MDMIRVEPNVLPVMPVCLVGARVDGKANFMVAAVDYAFSKRTDAYFAVDHTRISGGAGMEIDTTSHARSRTGITAGLRHRF